MGATILGYIPYMERIEKGGERGHIMIDRPESREREKRQLRLDLRNGQTFYCI